MTDILTRLAVLTEKNGNDMLPCQCGSTEFTFWDGKGTQAEVCCDACGNSSEVQVCDLFDSHDEFNFDMKTLRYPSEVIPRVNAEMVRRWNDRPREAALIALVQEAAAEIEELQEKVDELYPYKAAAES